MVGYNKLVKQEMVNKAVEEAIQDRSGALRLG